MSILYSEKIGDYTLQHVNGADIVKTYFNLGVKSCMSCHPITKFYAKIDGLTQIRVLWKNQVRLRALVWTAKSKDGEVVRVVDRIYRLDTHTNYEQSGCSCYGNYCHHYKALNLRLAKRKPQGRHAYKIFLEHWKQFADVRESNKALIVNIPEKARKFLDNEFPSELPELDTFHYVKLSDDDDQPLALSNRQLGDEWNHSYGTYEHYNG